MNESASTEQRTAEAVLPSFEAWFDGSYRNLIYRVMQVLFGEYLCRIGRESVARCHHCRAARDTTQHTLEMCSAFTDLRRILSGITSQDLGQDLSLSAVVTAMVDSERKK